jgi:hypothetical protein
MNYHRWTSVGGTIVTALDVKAYKRVCKAEAFLQSCLS